MELNLVNKPVMIRTYSAGVHYGILSEYSDSSDSYSVKLTNARRIYSWAGACSISQLATEGTTNTETKISVEVPSIYLKAIEVIEMTKLGFQRLEALDTWKIENKEEVFND